MFVCFYCKEAKSMKERVYLREGDEKCCTGCADDCELEYSKTKDGAPYPFVIHDNWIDLAQLVDDHNGIIKMDSKVSARTKFHQPDKGLYPVVSSRDNRDKSGTPPPVRETLAALPDKNDVVYIGKVKDGYDPLETWLSALGVKR